MVIVSPEGSEPLTARHIEVLQRSLDFNGYSAFRVIGGHTLKCLRQEISIRTVYIEVLNHEPTTMGDVQKMVDDSFALLSMPDLYWNYIPNTGVISITRMWRI